MNKLDSELLQAALRQNGLKYVATPADADVLLYNTCSVREQAEHRVFSHLGRWRKKAEADPGFILGVIGCMAQRLEKDIIRKFPFVRLVCGTQSFLNVPAYIAKISETGRSVIQTGGGPLEFERDPALRAQPHHAYTAIMRGCSNYCAYCIVPDVRGPEVSRPLAAVTDEVKRLAEAGVIEITLLGQNVNAYGRHPNYNEGAEEGLPALLENLNAIEGLKRIRFVTSHPKDMTDDILQAVAQNEKVCEHLHVPAQSGSDKILRAMNRKYSRRDYLEMTERARRIIPDVALSGDFIVGFPGETERDFQQTLFLLETTGFQQSYIFRYSPRPGTRAAAFEDDVPDSVKRERQQTLLAAQQRYDIKRRGLLKGAALNVMCTGKNSAQPHEGRSMGRTRQNDIVVFDAAPKRENISKGDICKVKIESTTALTLFGTELAG